MGRTNDAIIYGGRVHLFVTGPADEAKGLAEALPSRASRDFGAPFAEIFKRFKGDFYAIDPMLFSPAETLVTAIESGETFRAGAVITSCSTPRSPDSGPSADGPTVLVVSDSAIGTRAEWRRLSRPPGARVERLDLAACGFDTASPTGLSLPGFGSRLPDAVHVRTMSGGSFEAITKRLGVLHALTGLASSSERARAIERCVDKSMTSFLVARAGIPTPATWTLESAEAARALVEREARAARWC